VSILYAVDPGTIQSALVVLEHGAAGITVKASYTETNDAIRVRLRNAVLHERATLVIEQIQSMGMAVGQEVFQTVWWAGRFYEAWPNSDRYQLPRRPIKLHLCGTMQAKDSNVRAALIDKFGGSTAIGKKATPGPLYGLKGHEFAALAVAVTWIETAAAKCIRMDIDS
jgi:hypothetical protein